MTKKIQGALGKNAKTKQPQFDFSQAPYSEIGQVVMDSVGEYIDIYLAQDDGSALVSSIFSNNLRDSALFSARSARIAYLLGKATLLGETERKGIVRTQIIEYGAVAEAILLDLIQSVGVHDRPAGSRPIEDNKKIPIDWVNGGLFSVSPNNPQTMKYRFDFNWLIKEASRINAIDANLKKRVSWLRKSRNLVHPVIPTPQRYKDDVSSAKAARNTVIAVRDACTAYKQANGLP